MFLVDMILVNKLLPALVAMLLMEDTHLHVMDALDMSSVVINTSLVEVNMFDVDALLEATVDILQLAVDIADMQL